MFILIHLKTYLHISSSQKFFVFDSLINISNKLYLNSVYSATYHALYSIVYSYCSARSSIPRLYHLVGVEAKKRNVIHVVQPPTS